MERRKFLKLGGLLSAAATTGGAVIIAEDVRAKQEPLSEFAEGGILTAQQLNAMVARINELESRIS